MKSGEYIKKIDAERVLIEYYKKQTDLLSKIVIQTCVLKVLNIPAEVSIEPILGFWDKHVEHDFDAGIDRVTGYTCSQCGRWKLHPSSYCPNCGANMGQK